MRTLRIIICFILSNLLIQVIHSQDFTPKKINRYGYTTKTVKKGDRSVGVYPNEKSEIFRVSIKNNKSTARFELRAEYFEYGKHINKTMHTEQIEIIDSFKNGEKIIFDLVPDTTNSTHLILFFYFTNMTQIRYFKKIEYAAVKYKKINSINSDKKEYNPIMIIYMDDKNNTTENIINKRSSSIAYNDGDYSKLLKEIRNCMIIYYTLKH